MSLEVCVDSVASARAACAGGAVRLELCDGLVDGGVTPSLGKIEAVVGASTVPVNVLIRPRPGDFVYSPEEMDIMLRDIAHCKKIGVFGVVLGALCPDGSVDVLRTSELVSAAKPMSVTFHRAIDVCRSIPEAIHALLELGVDRILTSGQSNSAIEGAAVIKDIVEMVHASGKPCVVMAGGGVTAENVAELVKITGVTEVHATARVSVPSAMVYRHSPTVYMGGEKRNTPESEFLLKQSTRDSVSGIVQALLSS